MTHHSPAPFIVEYAPFTGQAGDEIPSFRIHDANGNAVCETDSGKSLLQQEADANLLAAAPELLDALRFCDMTLADLEASERKGYIAHAKELTRIALSRVAGGAA